MAHSLRNQGEEVERLVLFNVTPHDLFDLVSPGAQRRFRTDWTARARYVFAKSNPVKWAWHKLSRRVLDVAWRFYLPWAERLTPGDEIPSAEHLRAVLLAAFDTYEPRPFPGCTLLFAARETLPLYADDPAVAWAGLTTGQLHVHTAPHDGYSMLVEPDVRDIARRLYAVLEELNQ
jgi:thioesterase domain-containing protein